MRTLCFGDVHENVDFIEGVIKKESPDEVVFVGDFYDSFVSTKETVKKTTDWLLNSLYQPNRTHIFGNHDLPYAFPQAEGLVCSGHLMDKGKYINSIIKRTDWNKLVLLYKSQNFYFCHGGMHPNNFCHPVYGFTDEHANRLCSMAIELAKSGQTSPLLQAGWSRGGGSPTPGISWCDWDVDFRSIHGISQIVGHTPIKSPNRKGCVKYLPNKKNPNSINYCIDFGGRYYTIIEDGKVSYFETGSENNKRKHALLGEPFIDGRKIIESPCKCDDKIDGQCHHTHPIECAVCGSRNVVNCTSDRKYYCDKPLCQQQCS